MRVGWLALLAVACGAPAGPGSSASGRPSGAARPSAPLDAAAAPAASAAPPPRAPRPGYRLALPDRFDLEEGQTAAISLTIAPEPGYSISQPGPLRVHLGADPPAGLDLPRRRYQRRDAADRHADAPRFDLAVRGARAGHHRLAVDVRFWLCRSGRCRPIRVDRAVEIDVRPAAPPGGSVQR